MARCPECNKFTGKDTEVDPEVTSEPTVTDGLVEMEVRMVNNCAECSTELEEITFNLEAALDGTNLSEGSSIEWKDVKSYKDHQGKGHELSVKGEPDVSRTDSAGGRYAKRMYGVDAVVELQCACLEDETVCTVTMHDEVQASGMESMV
jgi:hypothetical protein